MSMLSAAMKDVPVKELDRLQKSYLTTTEFAELCGVSRFTIINWIKAEKIKAIRTIGKHYRIPIAEAASFLRALNGNEPECKSGESRDSKAESGERKGRETREKSVLQTVSYGLGRGVAGVKEKITNVKKGKKDKNRT